jgi:hypothetical protein
MAVPDAATDARQRRFHPDHACAILAVPIAALAVALWVIELGNGQAPLAPGLTTGLVVTAALLVVGWLIMSLERRVVAHLERIEGSRYRDGYADGYIEATNRRNGNGYERPTLRPVK